MRCSSNMKKAAQQELVSSPYAWCSSNGFPLLQARSPPSVCSRSPTITFSHSPTDFPFQRSLFSVQGAETRLVSLFHIISAVREGVSQSLGYEHIGVLQK